MRIDRYSLVWGVDGDRPRDCVGHPNFGLPVALSRAPAARMGLGRARPMRPAKRPLLAAWFTHEHAAPPPCMCGAGPGWPQRVSAQDPELRACGSLRRPCHWHRCQSVRPDRWSGVVRIRPRGLRSSRADSGAQVLPPARVTVPPWPHASTMIQWRQPSARAWLRLDWFVSADADCNQCLQNMTSGKCQKTSDTSSHSRDHTPTRPSACSSAS